MRDRLRRVIVDGQVDLPGLSHACVVGDLVYTAGVVGSRLPSLDVVGGGIVAEATQAFANLVAVLEACGSGPDLIVQARMYLTTFDDFGALDEVYRHVFGDPGPPRTVVVVAELGMNAQIEIECVALVDEVAFDRQDQVDMTEAP